MSLATSLNSVLSSVKSLGQSNPVLTAAILGFTVPVALHQLFYRPKVWTSSQKVIVITGASSGIGLALAKEYASQGAILLLAARRADRLTKLCEECQSIGAKKAIPVVADVSTREGLDALRSGVVQAVGEQGHVDLLVANAGISMGETFESLSHAGEALEVMERIMKVNYFGAIGSVDRLLPFLKRSPDGIRILSVCSVVGLVAAPTRSGYTASKFAMKGFFDSLRMELVMSKHPEGVFITQAYPGAVRTDINTTRLGLSSKKPSDLTFSKAMTPSGAAKRLVNGVSKGQRDIYFSVDGTFLGHIKARVIHTLSFFIPAIADKMIISTFKELSEE